MNRPLVSIIMSAYNGDKTLYLKECIDSINSQSYDNIELVIVNDGITKVELNDFLAALPSYSRFPVKLLQNPGNKGLAYSMNSAIERAGGEFLARMDADDVMRSDRIERQIEFLLAEPSIDIVGSWHKEISEEGEDIQVVKLPTGHDEMLEFFGKRTPLSHPCVTMRRSYFDKAGTYPLDTLRDEDTILWLNGFKGGARFANIGEPLTYMRVSNDFFRRRGGLGKSLSDHSNRLKVIRELKLSKKYYLYAYAKVLVQLIPSVKLKEFIYRKFR